MLLHQLQPQLQKAVSSSCNLMLQACCRGVLQCCVAGVACLPVGCCLLLTGRQLRLQLLQVQASLHDLQSRQTQLNLIVPGFPLHRLLWLCGCDLPG